LAREHRGDRREGHPRSGSRETLTMKQRTMKHASAPAAGLIEAGRATRVVRPGVDALGCRIPARRSLLASLAFSTILPLSAADPSDPVPGYPKEIRVVHYPVPEDGSEQPTLFW